MPEYTPNSNRFKEEQKNAEEKRVSKVVKGNVKLKKKSELTKLADVFIAEDVSNVKSYLFMDVLVPAAKKMIRDIVVEGIEMVLGTTGRSGKSSGGAKVSYARYYDRDRDDRRSSDRPMARSRFDYDDIVFESRGEATDVLDEMDNVIKAYGYVRVADLYDMANLSQPYTSNKFGWTSVANAEIVRVNGGYIIKLPRAMAID